VSHITSERKGHGIRLMSCPFEFSYNTIHFEVF